jgi:dihydroorotase
VTEYDLVIAGGTVIDPAAGMHERRDVAIADGRIAAVEPDIATSDATTVIEADGDFVVPGLVDLHVHVYPGVADL